MKNIIKTDNYLLVVDDSEIKVGDTVYYTIYGEDENEVTDTEPFRIGVDVVRDINSLGNLEFEMESLIALPKECKKIISHLPLNNSPILEGVPLLPPLEDDVYEMAQEYAINSDSPSIEARRKGFIDGYNKAKEKYKYTENDLRIAIQQAFLSGVERLEDFGKVESMLMENIQQPKYPIGFECELHETQVRDINTHELIKGRKKTTTNSQGQTVLEGKYIYD